MPSFLLRPEFLKVKFEPVLFFCLLREEGGRVGRGEVIPLKLHFIFKSSVFRVAQGKVWTGKPEVKLLHQSFISSLILPFPEFLKVKFEPESAGSKVIPFQPLLFLQAALLPASLPASLSFFVLWVASFVWALVWVAFGSKTGGWNHLLLFIHNQVWIFQFF